MLEDLKIAPHYDGFLFLAESVRNPPVLRPHYHVELELNVVVRGTVTYVYQGERYTFPPFSLLWFFPNQEHQLVDRSDDAAYLVAVFKPEMIRDTCRGDRYALFRQDALPGPGILHTILEPEVFQMVVAEMESVVAEGLDPDTLNREAGFGLSDEFVFEHHDPDWLNASLRHILLLCGREQRRSGVSGSSTKLHEAVVQALHLLGDPSSSSDLTEVSRQCALSPAYFSRLFHKEMGVPFARYRNSVRLGRFWDRYRNARHSTLIDAVYAAGFGSYPQFYRVFKQAHGKSPREMLTGSDLPLVDEAGSGFPT